MWLMKPRALLLIPFVAYLASSTPDARAEGTASWPALGAPARTGGGENDAAIIAAVERYAFVSPVSGASKNAVDWYNHFVGGRKIPLDAVRLLKDGARSAGASRW